MKRAMKLLLCALLVLGTLPVGSVFSENVSQETYPESGLLLTGTLEEIDFAKNTLDDLKTAGLVTQPEGTEVKVENDQLYLNTKEKKAQLKLQKSVAAFPEHFQYLFRFKAESLEGGGLNFMIHKGEQRSLLIFLKDRLTYQSSAGAKSDTNVTTEVGIWYTYLLDVNGANAVLYRKAGDETEYSKLIEFGLQTNKNSAFFNVYAEQANVSSFISHMQVRVEAEKPEEDRPEQPNQLLLSEGFDQTIDEVCSDRSWTVAGTDGTITTNNGTLEIRKTVTAANANLKLSGNMQMEGPVTFLYRVRLNDTVTGNGVSLHLQVGDCRVVLRLTSTNVIITSTNGWTTLAMPSETGAWYTYLIDVQKSGDDLIADYYRKKDGEADYAAITRDVKLQNIKQGFQLYAESTAAISASVDCIKAFTGIGLDGVTFTSNGQPVEQMPKTSLTASVDLAYCKGGAKGRETELILAVFDKNGILRKVVTEKTDPQWLTTETVSVTADLSDVTADLTEGSAALYAWNSYSGMQSLMRPQYFHGKGVS